MSRQAMTPKQCQDELSDLPGWELEDGRLHRVFQFEDFVSAFGFMTRAAFAAERINHHPNWANVYGKVEVTLWTHDAGGLTGLDFQLAAILSRLAEATGHSG